MKTLSFFSILILAAAAQCQNNGRCRDLPAREFALNMRFEAPAQLIYFSGAKISYNVLTRNEVFAGLSIGIDNKTVFQVGFEKDFRQGLWQIVFCADTGQALIVYKLVKDPKARFVSKTEIETRFAKERVRH